MSSNARNMTYTEENFDQLPFKVLSDNGDIVDAPTMVIVRTFPASDGKQQIGIEPSEISNPGEMSGNVLFVRMSGHHRQIMKIHPRDSYKGVSFWIRSMNNNYPITVLQLIRGSTVVRTKPVIANSTEKAVFFEVADPGGFDQIALNHSGHAEHDFQIDHIRLYK
ncbi:hypothetical protein [Pseudomonas moraviensis]|uniref:hypothetical protein n=1 Tax=Pseudomonas moraviensis TaxID=321662 RepID=UPI00105975D8|nr:hypothetical protein [Pseudomonas moraviensis]TDK50400.1 hypothetical protein E1508_27130 [Pseudomonas moraviensis]